MKNLLLSVAFIFSGLSICAQSPVKSNYSLEYNGEKIPVKLGEEVVVKSPGGEELILKFSQNEFLEYRDEMISFMHKNSYTISSTDLGGGITQMTILTATGGGIIIQEYTSMSPEFLVDLMLNELVSEDVQLGFKNKTETEKIKLKSGVEMKGKKATLKRKKEEKYCSVICHGKEGKGFLVMVLSDNESSEEDKGIEKLFWETLDVLY